MDDEELDEWLLLLRTVHDPDIWRSTSHGQQAEIRTQGYIVYLEHITGYLLHHWFCQNCARINPRSQASRFTP
jgi:hypothetical protein